jgi:hypothetical protein
VREIIDSYNKLYENHAIGEILPPVDSDFF